MSTAVAVPTLSKELFLRVLPEKMRKSVNTEVMDMVNGALSNPHEAAALRDNLIGYVDVLQDGKYKITDYVNAVKYCSYKLMGNTNIVAYAKAMPDRYQAFLDDEISPKDQSSYVSIYNKGKLVNAIMAQSLTPTHVLNQDLFQKALNVQAEIMVSSDSDKCRVDAANSILTHTKAPEVKKLEMDITQKADKSIDDLRQATLDLATQQRKMMQSGAQTAEQVAHSKVIEGEVERVVD